MLERHVRVAEWRVERDDAGEAVIDGAVDFSVALAEPFMTWDDERLLAAQLDDSLRELSPKELNRLKTSQL